MVHFLVYLCFMATLISPSTLTTSAFTFSNNAPSSAIRFSPLQQRQTPFTSRHKSNNKNCKSLQLDNDKQQAQMVSRTATSKSKTSLNLSLTPTQIQTTGEIIRSLTGVLLATKISLRGYKTKKSLSKSGAIAAFTVASLSLGCSFRSGMTLLSFYLTSSKLTRLGVETKKKIEDDDKAGVGKRDAIQVLSCSAVAVLCAVVRRIYVGVDTPLNLATTFLTSLGNQLTLAYVAFFACCAGDTWASELGVLSKLPPRLITKPWKVAVPGTNGAVSGVGLLASAAGGLTMGIIHGLLVPGWWLGLIGHGYGAEKWIVLGKEIAALAMVGLVGGLGGSLLDSFLGATVQATYYDPRLKKISKKKTDHTERIGGIFAILSNEMVNVVSTMITALCAALWAKPLLSWIAAI